MIVNHLVANNSISKQSRWVGIFARQLRNKTIEAVKELDSEALKFCLSYDLNFNEINNIKINSEESDIFALPIHEPIVDEAPVPQNRLRM